MKKTTLGALAALALLGGSAVALADGEHRHHGRQGQGATAPNAQNPQAHQHSGQMGQRMAEMHARMNQRHRAPQAGGGEPRGGQAPQERGHGHGHDHGHGHSH